MFCMEPKTKPIFHSREAHSSFAVLQPYMCESPQCVEPLVCWATSFFNRSNPTPEDMESTSPLANSPMLSAFGRQAALEMCRSQGLTLQTEADKQAQMLTCEKLTHHTAMADASSQ